MKTLILAFILLLPSISRAADWHWSTADSVREGFCIAATILDAGQTRDIRNHGGMIELNAWLGQHPSNGEIDRYFLTVGIVHPLIAVALPAEMELWDMKLHPRTAWQYVYLGVEGAALLTNLRGGLRLAF